MRRTWARLPISVRAVVSGLLIGLAPANVWPLLLRVLSVPLAATTEVVFLLVYLWWASGGGPPLTSKIARSTAFRRRPLTTTQWTWGLVAALSFAGTIHAAIVVLFRLVPFPTEAFRQGYDVSFIPSLPLKWIAVVLSAVSAGICEEAGFRGYMQQPIERRHGAPTAIVVSSVFFLLVHLPKGWAIAGMVPIVLTAGVLLGLLAWSSGSLIPGIVGHVLMDVGLFAYWWTGVAGDFTARPIADTGIDRAFLIACAVLAATLGVVLFATLRLRLLNGFAARSNPAPLAGSLR